MYYHPESSQEFANLHEFRLAFANTSFGMLDTEEERNATGLFTVEEELPESDNIYGFYTNNGVDFVDGKYIRKWLFNAYPPEKIRANLIRAVTDKRWQVETAGLTLPNGARVNPGPASIIDEGYTRRVGIIHPPLIQRGRTHCRCSTTCKKSCYLP